jgi:hypothetical protein
MASGRANILFRRIDAGYFRAQAGERFGKQAAAAAEIGDSQAGERLFGFPVARAAPIGKMRAKQVAQIAHAHGIEFVQRGLWPVQIPPRIAQPGETGQILGVDAGGMG